MIKDRNIAPNAMIQLSKLVGGGGGPIAGDVFYVAGIDSVCYEWLVSKVSSDKLFHLLDDAIVACTANQGDKIFVAPGYTENIAAATTVDTDIAGISIIGFGEGSLRPTLTQTVTTAYVDVAAANVTIKNILFKAGVNTGIAPMIQVGATGCRIEDCKFECVDNTLHTKHFIETSGAANACDDLEIVNCEFDVGAATATDTESAISLEEVEDSVRIVGCTFTGDYDVAAIHNASGKVMTNLHIANNYIESTQTATYAVKLESACTGFLIDNKMFTDAFATMLDPGALKCSGNMGCIAVDSPMVPMPGLGMMGEPRLASKTFADMSSGWAATNTPDCFTVTGTVLCRAFAVIATKAVTASHLGTYQFGTADDTDALLPAITVGDAVLDAGDVWVDATGSRDAGAITGSGAWVVVTGATLEVLVSTQNTSAGALTMYLQWVPISADGNVVAA